MIKKLVITLTSSLGMLLLAVVPVFAHVIVYPHQVGIAATQDFTVSVNEKDNPVTSVKLMIPDGLMSVVPDAIPGWTINLKSTGSGDTATVSEIDWTDGSIQSDNVQNLFFKHRFRQKQPL